MIGLILLMKYLMVNFKHNFDNLEDIVFADF